MGVMDESPPPQRTPLENHATLLVSWWCTICALTVILVRVIGRYVRTERLFLEDKIMAWAMIPLLIRMGLVHVVLLYGTNNTTLEGLTAEEVHHRSIGSRVVLGARIFYAMFIWVSKLTVSEFLKRLTTSSWNKRDEIILKAIRGFLLVTFIGVIIGTLAECQPFDHYWQVIPDPGGQCRNGYVQLFVMGICDIVTDVVLIIFPLPVILRSSMPIKRKISLILLYSLSAFLIAIAAYRIPAIVNVRGRQQRRSLWASIEILASAACSNAIIIGSFVRDRGVKKQKFKPEVARRLNSADAPSFNRTITRQHWGNDSDEDLFRACRGRMNSLASSGGLDSHKLSPTEPLPTIHSPHILTLDEKARLEDPEKDALDSGTVSETTKATSGSRTPELHESDEISIQDAGGLLGPPSRAPQTPYHSPRHSAAHDFAFSQRNWGFSATSSHRSPSHASGARDARRGSQGARLPSVQQSPRLAASPSRRPPSPNGSMELSDPGGLLR